MKQILVKFVIAIVTFFGSHQQIIKLAEIAGFDANRTLLVVKKARVWLTMFITFSVPFFFWFMLALPVLFDVSTFMVTETGGPLGTHFQWLWWNLNGHDAFAVLLIGAFPLFALLMIEWILWNNFNWERSLNKNRYLASTRNKLLYSM